MEWWHYHGMLVLPWNGGITMEWWYYYGMVVNNCGKMFITLGPGQS